MFRPLSGQGVGEDLADDAESLDELIRPGPEITKRPERDRTENDAPRLQGDRQVGFHPRLDDVRSLVDSLHGTSSGNRSKRITSPRRTCSAYQGKSTSRIIGGSDGYPWATKECVTRNALLSSEI